MVLVGPPVILWLIISLLIVAVLVAAVTIWKAKGKENGNGMKRSNYRTFFYMGLFWIPFGIFFWLNSGQMTFLVLGIIFTALGLANRKKWDKPEEVPTNIARRFTIAVVAVLLVFVLMIGLYVFY